MSKSSALKDKKSKVFLLALGPLFLIYYATHFPLPTEKIPIRFYATHKRDDLRLITLKTIKKAKQSIHIHTYALTDPSILSALMEKAKTGLPVHITYHRKNTPKLKTLPYLHLHPEAGRGLMHAKWVVIDETLTLLGTANLTTSSLTMHENFLMGVHAPDFAKALITSSYYQGTVGNQTLTFYLLPDPKALDHLLTLLDQTIKTVDAALFTFTHPLLIEKLVYLHQHGASISITLDRSSSRGASKKAATAFLNAGLPVRTNQGMPLFHHKWALIDRSTLVLGSANWTQAAFQKNKDYILFLSNLNKSQNKYLNSMINLIKKESINCN